MKTFGLISILVCVTSLRAQQTWIRTGITDTILAIHGDGTLIWAATEADGVKNFNPATGAITTYNSAKSGFPDNDFRSILCVNGDVYAGSNNYGLFILHDEGWSSFDTTNSDISGNSIKDIMYVEADSSIWFATDKGLSILKEGTWTNYDSIASPLAGNTLTCLYQSREGIIWIGTKYAGLSKYDNGTWETFNYGNSGINNNAIRAITQDEDDLLYVADYLGVNRYDIVADNWLFVYNLFTVPMTSEKVNRMGFDDDDNFWMATHGGVTRADSTNHFTLYYDYNSNLPNNVCDALYIDENNTVWVGTYGGLAFYTQEAFPNTITSSSMSIIPNPANTDITVTINQLAEDIPTFCIYDLNGKNLENVIGVPALYGECAYTINISDLPSGMYLLCAIQSNERMFETFVKL